MERTVSYTHLENENKAGRIETDAERLFLDHDTEFLLPLHLVLVLPLCGASGRALAGSDQHCPQCVRHTVHGLSLIHI